MNLLQIVLILCVCTLTCVGLRILLELYIKAKVAQRSAQIEYEVISVRVSRDNEIGPIIAEQIFATIHGIHRKISFWQRLQGITQDKISFELANIGRSIRFYIAFPKELRNLVEGQIYAQYPDVEIELVKDYSRGTEMAISHKKSSEKNSDSQGLVPLSGLNNLLASTEEKFEKYSCFRNAVGMELGLMAPDIYPIKRWPQFEDQLARVPVDPLAGITATFSKLNDPEDQIWMQLVISPLEDRWRVVFRRCIKIIDRGIFANLEQFTAIYARWYCQRSSLIRMIFFPLYLIFWFQGFGIEKTTAKSVAAGSTTESINNVEETLSRTNHEGETIAQASIDKVIRLMFDASLRIVYVPKHQDKLAAEIKLREIAGGFKQFNLPHLNGFEMKSLINGEEIVERFYQRKIVDPFVMNVEELATVYHLPSKMVATPNIYWVRSKKLEPPLDLPTPYNVNNGALTLLGKTNFRGLNQIFGIKEIDRRRHCYVIGKTGMGKSTLLENMIFSDINSGKGVAVVDPHGDLAESVLSFIPKNRINDVVLFNPADRDFPVAFNMLENVDPAFNTIVCSGLVGIFKKIYAHSWGPRLEHILRNTILSLLEFPGTTMLGITRILQDDVFRKRIIKKIKDPIVKGFWVNEFEKMQPRQRIEAISPILNKVGQFLASPIVRNIVGQPKSAVDLRFMMDKKKIIIVNLSKGLIGEDISSLLGSMIITKFQLDAMSRANVPQDKREDFYLYVDEFQNFATDSFATILSEARKYRLNLTMANQYIAQMPDEVRDAVFGNVGSILSFQVGFDDAEYLSQQFGEEASPVDLTSLSKYTAYMRLLVEGMPTNTFSLDTLSPPQSDVSAELIQKVIKVSRERYAKKRTFVEEKIKRWSLGEDEKFKKLKKKN